MEKKINSFFDEKITPHLFTKLKTPIQPTTLPLYRSSITKLTKNNIQKQIELLIDHHSLHIIQKNLIVKSLSFICLRLNIDNNIAKLFRNNKVLQILFSNDKKLIHVLKSRCILDSFHSDFVVIKMIGRGSFAKVYLATKNDDGQKFAIKAFNKEFILTQHKGKDSLINEMNVMKKLNHKNIIKLHEVYETTNSIYFVLDLLEGGELLHRVRAKGFINGENLKKLLFNFISALNYLHQQNIIHRDLKPENLLLKNKDNDTEIVIADFGLATILNSHNILFKRCGTPGFVAPEILNYRDGDSIFDPKCDIFSAGIIFYMLLTGKQPFSGQDYKSILKANKKCDINFSIPELSQLSPITMELLKKMLQYNPYTRFTTEQILNHSFFQQKFSEGQDLPAENLLNYEINFLQFVKQNVGESQNFNGSMELQTRGQYLNGRVETIGSIDIGSNPSILGLDSVNKIQYGVSKFAPKPEENQESGTPGKKRSQSKPNLHKLAIQNNYRNQFIQRGETSDALEIGDEYCQMYENVLTHSIHKRIRGSRQE